METWMMVGQLINCLTQNEDLRQELWVHYLSGNPIESLTSRLQEISNDHTEDANIRANIWYLLQNPVTDEFLHFLSNFSEYEKSIITLLLLGLTIEQISQHKGISQVRIKQTISSIRYNGAWEHFNGLKNLQNL